MPLSAVAIDYVVFPMSFYIEDGYVFLSHGRQDTEGWITRISLKELLASLKEVKTVEYNNGFAAPPKHVCKCSVELSAAASLNASSNGRYHQLDEFDSLHPCTTNSFFGADAYHTECGIVNSLQNVTYLIMTGSVNHVDRMQNQILSTWASQQSIRDRLIVVSDQSDRTVKAVTYPEMEGKKTYEGTQYLHTYIHTYILKTYARKYMQT